MFSWVKTSAAASYPGSRTQTEPQTQTQSQPVTVQGVSIPSSFTRQEHLQSYLNDPTLRPSTRRVSRDDTTYDTVFQTRGGHALILRVHLPPPNGEIPRTPAMTLVGVKATHPWLDRKMRVIGFSPIMSDEQWARSQMNLGQAVNRVVQHFQLQPPNVIEITDESLQRLQQSLAQKQQQQGGHVRHPTHPPNLSDSINSTPPQQDYEESLEFQLNLPPVPASFPELQTMPKSQMRQLLDDESAFQSYIEQMSAVTTVKDLMNSIFNGNVEAAQSNLEHEEELETLNAEIQALRTDLQEKVKTFQELESKHKELCTPIDAREVVHNLRKAKKDAFDESEEFASEWINEGEKDVDGFIKEFLEKRTLYHQRSAKIERLQNMLKQRRPGGF